MRLEHLSIAELALSHLGSTFSFISSALLLSWVGLVTFFMSLIYNSVKERFW